MVYKGNLSKQQALSTIDILSTTDSEKFIHDIGFILQVAVDNDDLGIVNYLLDKIIDISRG